MRVEQKDLSDAAVILLGHGTTLNAESATPVFQHAAELRRRGIFGEVREAFWKQPPQIKEVMGNVAAKRVFIVPMFISEGYFSDAVIPKELGFDEADEGATRVLRREEQTLVYCKPIGTHPSMTNVLLARAKGVIEKFPFPRPPSLKETTLFIAAHGTDRNSKSREPAELQVELIRAKQIYADVQAVFLDEEPRITAVHQLAQTKNVVVVPFFISDGLHVREDIPVLLGAPERMVKKKLEEGQPSWRNPMEVKGKLIWLASSVGTEPLVADVIVERVREASRAAS